jgi:5-(carboxyamino)imidazole ribonucleotide mutase
MSGDARHLVGIIMGGKSDWETMQSAESRGMQVIIAGAGGAAHLPGMVASLTTLPVIGVPVESKALHGMDSLLSIVQMPAGISVATMAIGPAGAKNAGLLAIQILALTDRDLHSRLVRFRRETAEHIAHETLS